MSQIFRSFMLCHVYAHGLTCAVYLELSREEGIKYKPHHPLFSHLKTVKTYHS